MANKSFPTADFTDISIGAPIDILVEHGPCAATATAAGAVPAELLVSVKNSTLVVETNGPIVTAGISLHILVTNLKRVEISASASLQLKDLNAPILTIHSASPASIRLIGGQQSTLHVALNGSEDCELSGQSDKLTVLIKKSADLDGRGHPTIDATVVIEAEGGAIINAKDTLNVKIPGAGSVKYLGDPIITKSLGAAAELSRTH